MEDRLPAVPQPAAAVKGKVAVIGSGPAGLSCAAELAQDGFAVTVFEERAQPGGVIRYGVPAYRFDTAFLANELADLAFLGVHFVCGTRIDGAAGVRAAADGRLQGRLPGAGLWAAERIPGGENVKGVLTSVDFLRCVREERFAEAGSLVQGRSRGGHRRRKRCHGLR